MLSITFCPTRGVWFLCHDLRSDFLLELNLGSGAVHYPFRLKWGNQAPRAIFILATWDQSKL